MNQNAAVTHLKSWLHPATSRHKRSVHNLWVRAWQALPQVGALDPQGLVQQPQHLAAVVGLQQSLQVKLAQPFSNQCLWKTHVLGRHTQLLNLTRSDNQETLQVATAMWGMRLPWSSHLLQSCAKDVLLGARTPL